MSSFPTRDGWVMGVEGPIETASLGTVAFHEHLVLDLTGHWGADMRLGDPATLGTELQLARAQGLGTVIDATTVDMGRNADIVRSSVTATGCHVIMSTGHYHGGTYPPGVAEASVDQLGDSFVQDIEVGIGGSDVKAGVIGELGLRGTELEDLEVKVFQAAAQAHTRTGASIITHTSNGGGGWEQYALLAGAGVDPARMVIGHLDGTSAPGVAARIAGEGAFVGIDRCGAKFSELLDPARIPIVLDLCEKGFARQVLLSSDIGRHSRLSTSGGEGYANIISSFVPQLRQAGLDESTLWQITAGNPARFLTGQEPEPKA